MKNGDLKRFYNKSVPEHEKDFARIEDLDRVLVPETLIEIIEGSDTVTVDINEVGDKVQVKLDQDVIDKIDRALTELTLTAETGGYVSTETFEGHVHILFEIESTGLHYGADFDLHPYNGSQCLVAFRMLISGSYKDGMAYIAEDGKVHIQIPDVDLSSSTVEAHYIEYDM